LLTAGVLDAGSGTGEALTPTQYYVTHIYQDVLQRPVDPSGLAFWSGAIDGGTSPASVVRQIEQSLEYSNRVVQDTYQEVLRRAVDPSGLEHWSRFLQQGGTTQQLTAQLLGCDEYFMTQGLTDNGHYLEALYRDALGRGIDPTGQTSWGNALANGAGRDTIAQAILSSDEGESRVVDSLYQRHLARSVDPVGLQAFVPALQHGASPEDVTAALLTSKEYTDGLNLVLVDTAPANPQPATNGPPTSDPSAPPTTSPPQLTPPHFIYPTHKRPPVEGPITSRPIELL
jgi:hypothetical protein